MNKGIGIVLARAGSKGLKNKNIRTLSGQPLIFHTLRPMIKNNNIYKIIVSTDGHNIKKIVDDANLSKVEVHLRPNELSGDEVTTKDTLKYVYDSLADESKKADFFVYMQITEPVRPIGILDKCIEAYNHNDCDSVFAAYEMHKNFWTPSGSNLSRLSEKSQVELPRQKKIPIYREDTGICSVISPKVFASGDRIGEKPFAVVYDHPGAFIDIHNESDLKIAEKIFEMNNNVE